jgi:hypothetical protein
MSQLKWITRNEWLEHPQPECIDQMPKEIAFTLPLDGIRARINSPDPRFTPIEDEDFPGPVERWYGSFSGRGFTLTYHYQSPVTDQVVASHCETAEFSSQLEEAFTAWREISPY